MAWFFANDDLTTEYYTITGEDASHIARSLRMKIGEALTLCTPDGRRHECEITEITRDDVTVRILRSTECEQEPDVRVNLFIALMKGDKIDDVVQKSMRKKLARWQKIADNAASQSRRGIIPRVNPCVSLRDIPDIVKDNDMSVVFYECGGEKLGSLILGKLGTLALITGSEGGFEQEEIDYLTDHGVKVATLGKRILRAQTAPVAALCAAMLLTGNLE